MVFFFGDWAEWLDVASIWTAWSKAWSHWSSAAQAGCQPQYRVFRFDTAKPRFRAAFVFIRRIAALSDVPAETLAAVPKPCR